MKDVKKEQDIEDGVSDSVEEEEKPTEVVDSVEEEKPTKVVDSEEEKKPTEVVENPDDKIEGEDSGEETEELSDEEGES